MQEMIEIIELDLYISLNGDSLRTKENLEVVREIPIDRLLVETDCPFSDIRISYPSAALIKTHFPSVSNSKYVPQTESCQDAVVRNRHEPCMLVQIIEVIAAIKELPVHEVAS
jgi:TatD DNase family protein